MDTGTIISVAALVTTLINTSTSGNLLSVALRPFKWLTEKTKNFLFNFMKKMESEDINVTILTDEKRIKILIF